MDPVIVMVLFFILILGGGAAYYFLVYKKDDEAVDEEVDKTSTTPADTTTPASTTTPTDTTTPADTTTPTDTTTPSNIPLETLLAGGQALQVEELAILKNPIPFTISPTGIDTKKVTYSMSLDINVLKEPDGWYCILSNNKIQDWSIGPTVRRPAVFMSGPKLGARIVNIVHSAGGNDGIFTEFAAKVGTYFNLTFVVDNGKGITYINGVKDSKGEWSGAFTWSSSANEWTWNHCNSDILIKVKNVYWFNKALTADEAKLIGTKQTSGTSTYALPPKNEPEPYSPVEYGTLIF